MTDYSGLLERLDLHNSWRDSHGELNDAPNQAKTAIETLTRELAEAVGLMGDASRDCVEIGLQTYGRKPHEMRETSQGWKLQKVEEITRNMGARFRTFLAK